MLELLLFFFIFLDQISKWWAQQQGLVTWNEGIAFGFGGTVADIPMTMGLVFLMIGVGWILWRFNHHRSYGGLLMLTGAASNLIDRLAFGAVRDWLPVPFVGVQNNLADWLIAVGMILLIKELFLNTILKSFKKKPHVS